LSPLSVASESGVTNSDAERVRTDPEREAAVAAAPDQLQALVGGDAAADDEQDALAAHEPPPLPQDQEPVNSPK
jgi:hypothetical protein